jgi:hypothetical protein
LLQLNLADMFLWDSFSGQQQLSQITAEKCRQFFMSLLDIYNLPCLIGVFTHSLKLYLRGLNQSIFHTPIIQERASQY